MIAKIVDVLQHSDRIRDDGAAAFALQAICEPRVRPRLRWDARPLQGIVADGFQFRAVTERGDGKGLRGLLHLHILLGDARRVHGEVSSLEYCRS